jgi:hypothetical protein
MPKIISAMSCSSPGGQAREAAADEVAGEVLGGDAGRPALPALAEVCEVGQDDIAQDGRQGQLGHEPVQDGLRGRLVEGVQSPAEPGEGRAARGRRAGMGARAISERGARRLGRGQPFGQVCLHAADPRLVGL